MQSVMVDNWFMEDVITDICNMRAYSSHNYSELLMAIVLWDEVYFPQNKYTWWKNASGEIQNILCPVEDIDEEGKFAAIRELYRYKGVSDEEFYWLKWKNSLLLEPEDVISSGAIRYLSLSRKNGLDYLPCDMRQNFLREYCSAPKILSRIKLQSDLTKLSKNFIQKHIKV